MGIPRFYGQWLEPRNYPGVISKNIPEYVSSLLIDMNAIIHEEAGKVYGYDETSTEEDARHAAATDPRYLQERLFRAISTRILNLCRATQVREILVLAVDGVAPLAKIQQQRSRRYRSAEERKGISVFDSNVITPGTQFMMDFDSYIRDWMDKLRGDDTKNNADKPEDQRVYSLPPKVVYSSHLIHGEGEHKIIDMMRDHIIEGNGAHIIHGLDADLIMLSLIAPLGNIYLMREDYPFRGARYKEAYIVNIDLLKQNLEKDLGLPSANRDFVIMMYLLGNDFLPKVISLDDLRTSLDLMFEVYRAVSRPLTQEIEGQLPDIDWVGFAYFITTLAQYEGELLAAQSVRSHKYPSRMMDIATTRYNDIGAAVRVPFNFDLFRGAWYSNVLGAKGDTSLFETFGILNPYPVDVDRLGVMIKNYLNGLAWVFSYYVNGISDINISYIYRYSHAPLLNDIASSVAMPPVLTDYQYNEASIPFGPLQQLLAVIPPKSKNILPPELLPLTTIDSPISDMFPLHFILERDGTDQDWAGVVILPPVEADRIIDASKLVPNDPKLTTEATEYILFDPTRYARVTAPGYVPPVIVPSGRGRGRGQRGQRGDRGRGGYQGQQQRGGYQGQQQRGGYQGQQRGGYQGQRGGYRGQRGGYQGQRGNRGGNSPPSRGRGRGRPNYQPDAGYYPNNLQGGIIARSSQGAGLSSQGSPVVQGGSTARSGSVANTYSTDYSIPAIPLQ